MDWTETNHIIKGIWNNLKELQQPVRVAGFDLDDTLIHRPTHRGKNQNIDNKWKLINTDISDKINELVEKKYIIVIFTNQGGMSVNKNFDKLEWRKAMIDLIKILTKKLTDQEFYFAVYVAKTYDLYRKPNTGLWEQMKLDLKDQFGLDKVKISSKSFFCGDAAGRITSSFFRKKIYPSSKKGDFSDTDRKFAENIGIKFLTPEKFYLDLDEKISHKYEGFNPHIFLEELKYEPEYQFVPRKKEMIIMVGPAGSGKSEFVKKNILPHGYVYINRDTCRTKEKCIKLTVDALEKKKSVVIDNTNPDVISRMTYTSLAVDHGYKHIRCIIMKTDIELAKHLNNVRHVYSNGDIPKVHDMAYNIFNKSYIKPILTEHFDKIEEIDFYFDKTQLDDPHWKKIFMKWS